MYSRCFFLTEKTHATQERHKKFRWVTPRVPVGNVDVRLGVAVLLRQPEVDDADLRMQHTQLP